MFTYTADGLIGEDTLTGVLSREAGEEIGEYAFTLGTLGAADNNYAVRLLDGENVPKFAIVESSIDAESITVVLEQNGFLHDDEEKTPVLRITDGQTALVPGVDYEVTGDTAATDIGVYTLTITGIGKYAGMREIKWAIADPQIVASELADTNNKIRFGYEDTYAGTDHASFGFLCYRSGDLAGDMTVDMLGTVNGVERVTKDAATGSVTASDKGNGIYLRSYMQIGDTVVYGEQIFVKYADLS